MAEPGKYAMQWLIAPVQLSLINWGVMGSIEYCFYPISTVSIQYGLAFQMDVINLDKRCQIP